MKYKQPKGTKNVDVFMATKFRSIDVVDSLKSVFQPEVHCLHLVLNDYTRDQHEFIRGILEENASRVEVYRRNNNKLGGEKFYPLMFAWDNGIKYAAFCDDDIVYPTGYFTHLIDKAKKYKCAVGYHGRILSKEKVKNYYDTNQRIKFIRHNKSNDKDTYVDVLADGCMLVEKSLLGKEFPDFYDSIHPPTLDELMFNKFCSDKGVKRMVVEHSGLKKLKQPTSMFKTYQHNCPDHKNFVNNVFTERING